MGLCVVHVVFFVSGVRILVDCRNKVHVKWLYWKREHPIGNCLKSCVSLCATMSSLCFPGPIYQESRCVKNSKVTPLKSLKHLKFAVLQTFPSLPNTFWEGLLDPHVWCLEADRSWPLPRNISWRLFQHLGGMEIFKGQGTSRLRLQLPLYLQRFREEETQGERLG